MEEGFHFLALGQVSGGVGQVGLERVWISLFFQGVVLGEIFVRIGLEVEQLGFVDLPVHHVVLDEFPVAAPDASHAGLCPAAVDAEERVTDGVRLAKQHRLEAAAFVGFGDADSGQIAECRQHVEQVAVPLRTRAGRDAGALDDQRHAPCVLVKILFALQAVPANRHAVVGGVNNKCVFEFAHRLEFFQHAANLGVDVFATRKLPANLVPDRALVASLPDAGHVHFITQPRVAVVEGMLGQPVDRQLGRVGAGGRRRLAIGMVHCAVFFQKLRRAVTFVVRVGETEINQERVVVPGLLPVVEVVEYLFGVPSACLLYTSDAADE